MNLNAVMSIIANVPAAIASTVCGVFPHMSFCPLTSSHQIVACRVVRRLTNYTTEGAEVFGYVSGTDAFNFIYTYTSRGYSTTEASTLAFHKSGRFSRGGMLSVSEKKPDGVHVQVCLLDFFLTDAVWLTLSRWKHLPQLPERCRPLTSHISDTTPRVTS